MTKDLIDELICAEERAWGKTMHGLTEVMPVMRGKEIIGFNMKVTTYISDVGRRFVRGREVYKFLDKTILGEDFFSPSGLCGGRILS